MMSPGLMRAREPFRLRNALTGLLLGGFAVSIWAYSMRAVKQDSFEDVDEEARELAAAGEAEQVKSLEDEAREREASAGVHPAAIPTIVPHRDTAAAPTTSPSPSPSRAVVEEMKNTHVNIDRPRGVVASLIYPHHPQWLDPKNKTLVWGAPPVDNFGRLRDLPLFTRN